MTTVIQIKDNLSLRGVPLLLRDDEAIPNAVLECDVGDCFVVLLPRLRAQARGTPLGMQDSSQ